MTQDQGVSGRVLTDHALVSDQAATRLDPTGFDPSRLSYDEQMKDAETKCVPCKLCGGKAVVADAGPGSGYYISCSRSLFFRESDGCLLDERRLGGWAYNVMNWWNRLHASGIEAASAGETVGLDRRQEPGPQGDAHPLPGSRP